MMTATLSKPLPRYSLHTVDGVRIGEGDTLQAMADIAQHGTFSYDTQAPKGHPSRCVAYIRADAMTIIGHPFAYRFEAMNFLRDHT